MEANPEVPQIFLKFLYHSLKDQGVLQRMTFSSLVSLVAWALGVLFFLRHPEYFSL